MHIASHAMARAGFREVFFSAASDVPVAADRARAAFDALAATLVEHRAEPMAERIYGTLAAREAILAARRAALRARKLDDAAPVTFLDGTPAAGGDFAGVQVWAIAAGAPRPAVRTVSGGRLWSGPGFRMLQLSGMHGSEGETVTRQAEQMLAQAAAAAESHGFSYAQTVRTWIYLARLLDWYGEFNRVRTGFYRRYDFVFPASTGIQGRSSGAECTMDALLLEGIPAVRIERSVRQGPAFAYGSAFSRATAIQHGGGPTVHVSGTASIDHNGRSVHLGDPTAQFLEMLLDVAAVLDESGLSLANIVQATLFCKDQRTWAACQQARALLGVPGFPTVSVIADVCRPELLVEMEAVAAR